METIDIPVCDIIVRDRVRKDLGDTTSLMQSMAIRQIHPIGVTADNVLLFGARRLDAAKRAGWATIRATRFTDLDDVLMQLQVERDENEERKPFTPSEAVAMGVLIESLEKPKAQNRKVSGKNQHSEPSSKLDEGSKGRTDEKVAAAVGMSKNTYRKAKAVVEAAEQPDATPEVKEIARKMDETGKVAPAYEAMRESHPREPNTDNTIRGFDASGARARAEKAIKGVFSRWPEWARKDIPKFLRQLAKGEW